MRLVSPSFSIATILNGRPFSCEPLPTKEELLATFKAAFLDVADRVRSGTPYDIASLEVAYALLHAGAIPLIAYDSLQQKLQVVAQTTQPDVDFPQMNASPERCDTKQAAGSVPGVSVSPAPAAVGSSIVFGQDVETGQKVTLNDSERTKGVMCSGTTGFGKTSFLTNIFLQDIDNGHGGFFLDPDGDAIAYIQSRIPPNRLKDCLFIEPGNMSRSIGINRMVRREKTIDADVDRVLNIFQRIWGMGSDMEFWGPKLENVLAMAIYLLIYNELTLAELLDVLLNDPLRNKLLAKVPDRNEGHYVRLFWERHFAELNDYGKNLEINSTLNKAFRFLTVTETLKMVGQQKTTFDFRTWIDEGKIILCNLSPHIIGKQAARFIGTLLVAELFHAAKSRIDLSPHDRRFFSVVIDEFSLFASSEFEEALPIIRKYGLGVTVATQYLDQLGSDLKKAVLQMGSHVTFRCIPPDADIMARYFASNDLVVKDWKKDEVKTPLLNPATLIATGARAHTNNLVNDILHVWEDDILKSRQGIKEDVTIPARGDGTIQKGRNSIFVGFPSPTVRVDPNNDVVEAARWRVGNVDTFFHQVMLEKYNGSKN